ncbi:MAG: SIR2 family protein [Bacteroidetes bacterium]|nr:SIR2 family protein [Bacteroidota bacterium]MBU1113915.1 SIR2 family protein [Bacteroidota bacterium]MBU1798234.1 SIR2 family protein [Bacteroidota bacterium]
MNKDENIPINILPYFLEIAERLWTGHATIMIGAGFSKNAKKSETTKKGFPDWNTLGDVFYEKIHGNLPLNKSYLNVLKLADEVQAAFGRNTLENILQTEIPDKEYEPSDLHEKVLQLPWTDVFTTNYDTLLERAAEKILQYRYDTVLNTEDLVYSSKPRIIKLHGSFPSERPFIITEEDYRKYPKEFAPFVNTVQQSLLENTLCLIGFSGDDPNFLKWIGWIRDNLGRENSPKIYLIGILSLSIAQKKLLEQRNIVPLDLSTCENINDNHEKSLTIFLDFLKDQAKFKENLGWPEKNIFFHFKQEEEISEQLPPIIENWKLIREKYPNWLIVPDDRRDELRLFTESSIFFIYHLLKIKTHIALEFLYEFNWRIEKCLIPIQNDLINIYETIINRYNPFPNLYKIDDAIDPNSNNELDWKAIALKWVEIQFSMLRFYREEGFHDKWEFLTSRIDKLLHKLTPDLKARYYYERSLYYLFALNISSVRKELDFWPTDISLPYWEAKKAGLLAELGDIIEAEKILERSLKSIRSLLNLSPIVNDYSIVSQEAYIMQLLKYVKTSVSNIQGTFNIPEYINQGYTERWNTLVQYKCDPWGELKSFNLYLDKIPPMINKKARIYEFDIGSITTSHNFVRNDEYLQRAYSYLRYIEEIGIPYQIPGITFGKEAAKGAISYISNYSPNWAIASYIRYGNIKEIDFLFNRKSISRMNSESIDKIIIEYLTILENSSSEIKQGDTFINKTFAISLSTIIPEILSRLCVKSSHKVKMKLLEFLKITFESDLLDRYKGILNLTKRLIMSFSEATRYSILPILLDFKILGKLKPLIERDYVDPINFIYVSTDVLASVKPIKINKVTIDNLLKLGKESIINRQAVLGRLIKLWELDLLSEKQSNQLGILIWSKTDETTGFPLGTNFYNYSFINLPHPKNINPENLLRKFISNSKFPIQATTKEKSIQFIGNHIPIFKEIIGTSSPKIKYTWQINDISILVSNIVVWWDADKQYLRNDNNGFFGSISEEFTNRFANLVVIFSRILATHYSSMNEKNKNEVLRILFELKDYNLPYLEALASFYNILPNKQKEIYLAVYKNLFSKSNSIISDSLSGAKKLIQNSDKNCIALINVIGEIIRGLNTLELDSYLNVIADVVKDYPELVNTKLLKDIEIGLSNLVSETIILPYDSNEEFSKKLIYKRQVAKLSVALYKYYESKKSIMPNYLLQWKEICLDINEFSEIRNIWLNEFIEMESLN